jgi:hypothetical protein
MQGELGGLAAAVRERVYLQVVSQVAKGGGRGLNGDQGYGCPER